MIWTPIRQRREEEGKKEKLEGGSGRERKRGVPPVTGPNEGLTEREGRGEW